MCADAVYPPLPDPIVTGPLPDGPDPARALRRYTRTTTVGVIPLTGGGEPPLTTPDITNWRPVPYPAQLHAGTIGSPLPVGVVPGRTIGPVLRRRNAYVWGLHGSGRTVLLADLVAGALQCTDTLVWLVGTGLARPFLHSFAHGDTDRPAIDWVAPDLTELRTMIDVAGDIAAGRAFDYAGLMFEHNTTTLPVGDGRNGNPPPHILIVTDTNNQFRGFDFQKAVDDLTYLADQSGSAGAITVVHSGLRPTYEYIPPRFGGVRIAMRPTDQDDLKTGFGCAGLPLLPHAGAGLIRYDYGQCPEPFQAFHLDPHRTAEIGEQTTAWRPAMDTLSRERGGAGYAGRWARTAPQLWTDPRRQVLDFT